MARRKIIIFFIFYIMLISTCFTYLVIAGDENNPEIEDNIGDARPYLDIEKAWFFEDEQNPEYLYTTIKLQMGNKVSPQQHLTIHWKINGEIYWTMCGIGYSVDQWIIYNFGIGTDQWNDRAEVFDIEGEYNTEAATVTCKIPKELLNNPTPGTILKDTESQCFERFGLWGRLGFGAKLRFGLFSNFNLPFLQIADFAPNDSETYGKDYIIKY